MKWLDKLTMTPARTWRLAVDRSPTRGPENLAAASDDRSPEAHAERHPEAPAAPAARKLLKPLPLAGSAAILTTTRAQLVADIRAAGLTEAAVAAVARATAPARHEGRVAQVLTALGGVPTAGPARARFVMQLLCELHGVGGTADQSGAATLRMPWASSLGSGRKHAIDGSAWTAAILDAFWRSYHQFLLPPTAERPRIVIRPEVLGFGVAIAEEADASHIHTDLGTWIPAPADVRWAHALALRALLATLGLPAPEPAPSFAAVAALLAFDGSAIAWSRLIERLQESAQTPIPAQATDWLKEPTPAAATGTERSQEAARMPPPDHAQPGQEQTPAPVPVQDAPAAAPPDPDMPNQG